MLCHICRSWRDAALSTPRLWAELALELEYVSLRQHVGAGFLRKKLEILNFWASPSLHLIRQHSRITTDDADKFASYLEFFACEAIQNAKSLELYGFSALDFSVMSKYLNKIAFHNLETLSVGQPSGREDNASSLQFPPTLALRRLYFDFHMEYSRRPSVIADKFSWRNITHLSANMKLMRNDWYRILDHCTNLMFGSFRLEFLHPSPWASPETNTRSPVVLGCFKQISVQCPAADTTLVFEKFVFPHMTSLRLSQALSTFLTLQDIHCVLSSTPSLRELHLQSCLGFGNPDFLTQVPHPTLFGPLSTFTPNLSTLVIDSIKYNVPSSALPRDLLTLLHSDWLNRGWSSDNERSLEFILDKGMHFSNSIIRDLTLEFNESGTLPFRVSSRHVKGGLFEWRPMNTSDLADRWHKLSKFQE